MDLFILALAWRHKVLLVQDSFRLPPVISAVVSIYLITSTTVPQIPVLVLRPEFGARFAPSVHDDISLQNSSSPGVWHNIPFTATSVPKLIFFTPISTDGRRGLFPLWDSSQSFGFYLLIPHSDDSLGQLYVPILHSLPIRSQSANICWFQFWPGFVTSGLTYITIPLLTVILWRPANSNTRDSINSLFLFSQWETTWH